MGRVTVVGSYIVALVIDTDCIPLEGQTVVGGITTAPTVVRDRTWRCLRRGSAHSRDS